MSTKDQSFVPNNVVMVTGGLGFIASHMVIHLVLKYPEYLIVNFDKVDYCSSFEYLKEVEGHSNYEFIEGDILNSDLVSTVLKKFRVGWVIHFAAQTHVDNSFNNSISFTKNNVLGTHVLVECCRKAQVKKYVHVSTDEVYGESAYDNTGALEHVSLLKPTNPYAASKAAAEHIVLSYYKSWDFPCIITRSNNIYGPHQFPEKVIPKWICLLEKGWKIPVHGDGSHKRAYLYVKDVVEAYDTILHKGRIGEVYNISSDIEYSNLELAHYLVRKFNKDPKEVLEYVEDRRVNDQRFETTRPWMGAEVVIRRWYSEDKYVKHLASSNLSVEWYRGTDLVKVWGPQIYVYAFPAHPRVPHKL